VSFADAVDEHLKICHKIETVSEFIKNECHKFVILANKIRDDQLLGQITVVYDFGDVDDYGDRISCGCGCECGVWYPKFGDGRCSCGNRRCSFDDKNINWYYDASIDMDEPVSKGICY
jgi:hypothetical protein